MEGGIGRRHLRPARALDFSWADWRFALRACGAPRGRGEREELAGRIERAWSGDSGEIVAPVADPGVGDALACTSVRSAFDLLLRAASWERGDEIIFSAVTIPDMPRVARAHGLSAVPLDIHPRSTEPCLDDLAATIGPRTRALVLAHLFGGRLDATPAIDLAHRHGLLFVEDCAQAYDGPAWTGHEGADVTLFSFGPLKPATALGGGLVRVRDPELLARMRSIASRDPVQTTNDFAQRALGFGALKALSGPGAFGAAAGLADLLGQDYRRWVERLTKSYRGPRFLPRLRKRPSEPLLALLERRLQDGDAVIRRREAQGRKLMALLDGAALPAARASPHGFWLFPVCVDDPPRLLAALEREGFHGTPGRMEAVSDDTERKVTTPGADELLRTLVCIPCEPEMGEDELERLAAVVRREPA